MRYLLIFLFLWLGVSSGYSKPEYVKGLPLKITTYGLDLIVHFEVGGASYYKKAYQRPVWPEGASGVTVGIGYDLGYNTKAQIRSDWCGRIPRKMVEALESCAGIKGSKARYYQQKIRWQVVIPLEAAMDVFINRSVTRFSAITKSTSNTIEKAHPYIQDMMLSQTFNRGSSIEGYSRRHVLWQSRSCAKGQYYALPEYCRDSKVVWANKPSIRKGIWRRRDTEAAHGFGGGNFIPQKDRVNTRK